jgi:hypothetical protein
VKTRNVVIGAIVLVVATTAATSFVLDLRQPEGVSFDSEIVTVIVAKRDIPANEPLDPLIEDGVFKEFEIPVQFLVPGVITDVDQMRGQTTSMPILAREQVSSYRIGYPLGT